MATDPNSVTPAPVTPATPAPAATAKTDPTPAPTVLFDLGDGQKVAPEVVAKRFKDTQAAYTKATMEKAEVEKRLAALEAENKARGSLTDELSRKLTPEQPKPLTDVERIVADPDYRRELALTDGPRAVELLAEAIRTSEGRMKAGLEESLKKIEQAQEKERLAAAQDYMEKEKQDVLKVYPEFKSKSWMTELEALSLDKEPDQETLNGQIGVKMSMMDVAAAIRNRRTLEADEITKRAAEARTKKIEDDATQIGPGATPSPEALELGKTDLYSTSATKDDVIKHRMRLRELDKARHPNS